MSSMKAEMTEGEPGKDRFTRLADAALKAIEAHPDYRESDQVIVAIDSEADQMGGFGARGYQGHADLFVSIIDHAKGVLEASGKAKMIYEKQPDGSWIVRIRYSHTGKDVAAEMARKFLRR